MAGIHDDACARTLSGPLGERGLRAGLSVRFGGRHLGVAHGGKHTRYLISSLQSSTRARPGRTSALFPCPGFSGSTTLPTYSLPTVAPNPTGTEHRLGDVPEVASPPPSQATPPQPSAWTVMQRAHHAGLLRPPCPHQRAPTGCGISWIGMKWFHYISWIGMKWFMPVPLHWLVSVATPMLPHAVAHPLPHMPPRCT